MAAFNTFLQNAGDKIVAVDFTATWCGPCKMIGPRFVAMSTEMTDCSFCKIDVDEAQDVAAMYGIKSMPTFMFFRHGTKMDEFSGADENRLRGCLNGLRLGLFDIVPANTAVRIHGIAAKPELNGKAAVIKAFDPLKGRYRVQLEDDSSTVSLKQNNLIQRLAVKVLQSDGQVDAKVDDADGEHAVVEIAHGVRHSVPSDELILPDGCTPVVLGLQGAPQFNGKTCKIISYDDESGRYLVQMLQNKQLKLKRANVSAFSAL
jgi:thioredoxin